VILEDFPKKIHAFFGLSDIMTPLKQRLVNRPPNLVAVFRILTLLTPEIWWLFFEEQVDLHPSRYGRSDDS